MKPPVTTEDRRLFIEPSPKRIRVMFGGETVADSTRVLLLHELGLLPVYYFPPEDVRGDLLEPTEHRSRCPWKGEAHYRSIRAGDRLAENAVWTYPQPVAGAAAVTGYMAFYWDRMDHWYEEDEEIFVHARDPYSRIDTVASSRPVRVILDGETVAETTRARFLFETGLPVRYYIPQADVRMDLLEPTETRSRCPYKGEAVYWSARTAKGLHEDIVWSYPAPIPECPKIRDLMCFYNERIDDILVDGEAIPKVKTKWSPK